MRSPSAPFECAVRYLIALHLLLIEDRIGFQESDEDGFDLRALPVVFNLNIRYFLNDRVPEPPLVMVLFDPFAHVFCHSHIYGAVGVVEKHVHAGLIRIVRRVVWIEVRETPYSLDLACLF